MKIKLRYILILLFVIFAAAVLIFYKCCLYYPDIEIKVSDLYNDHSNVVRLNGAYYKVEDGNIYNLDDGESIFQTTDKQAFAKEAGDLLWIVDNSGEENLKALDSSGEIVKSYSIPNNTEDILIGGNDVFCMLPDEIKAYRLYDNGRAENIPINYSFVYESDKCGFKLYRCSCEDVICLWFDITDYKDAYFVVDFNGNDVIGNDCPYMQLLNYETDHIVFNPPLFQLEILYDYSFEDDMETCYNADVRNYAQGFFENTPYVSNDKYIISVAQQTTSRSITRDGGPAATSCEMSKHKSDCLYIINADDCAKSFRHSTKTFERILYADDEKAITYYDGEYLTYSLDKWEVIDSRSADEIQNGGSYTFENCGDYIFVFDDSGRLLNTIDIT